jgi:hypothetical protein
MYAVKSMPILKHWNNSATAKSTYPNWMTVHPNRITGDRAIDPTFVYLFVEKENGNFEIIRLPDENPLTKSVNLHSEHPLVQVFQRRREYIRRRQLSVFPELQAMSKQDSESLNQINAEIYFPIGAGELSVYWP